MDIYITEKDTGTQIGLSMLPQETKRDSSTRFLSFDVINIGEIKIPKGANLMTFSWSGIFPGEGLQNSSNIKKHLWRHPKELEKILDDWRKAGTRLVLMVTETYINHEVILSDFSAVNRGGNGDVEYDITFVEAKDLNIYTTAELNIKPAVIESSASTAVRPASAQAESKTHTVVSGDTLWRIAQKYLGAGSRYPEVYNANQSVIEAEAKRRGKQSSSNGHWIYPGTVLVIPG